MQQKIMAKFRKKPVVVDAFRASDVISSAATDWKSLPECIAKAYEEGDILFLPQSIWIRTLEGRMEANCGDWIIRGVKGELYPCKPDIFTATYEATD